MVMEDAETCFCCLREADEDAIEMLDEGAWLTFCGVGCLTYYLIKTADHDTLALLCK